jgi:hypothetical protein
MYVLLIVRRIAVDCGEIMEVTDRYYGTFPERKVENPGHKITGKSFLPGCEGFTASIRTGLFD